MFSLISWKNELGILPSLSIQISALMHAITGSFKEQSPSVTLEPVKQTWLHMYFCPQWLHDYISQLYWGFCSSLAYLACCLYNSSRKQFSTHIGIFLQIPWFPSRLFHCHFSFFCSVVFYLKCPVIALISILLTYYAQDVLSSLIIYLYLFLFMYIDKGNYLCLMC